MKKVRFIYNPYSGGNTISKELDLIIEIYQEHGYTIMPFRISRNISISEALDIQDLDHILIAGGDGTINNVINAIKNMKLNVPIGILPTGTANDFATCIGISKNIRKACLQIINSSPINIDLGKVNEKYFINVASMGLFTDVSQKTNVNLKSTVGKLAYYLSGIKEFPKFKKLKLKITTEDFTFDEPSLICFIFNGKTAGNLKISYKSKINDGFLDLVIVKDNDPKNTLLSLFEFFKEEHLENPKGIIYYKSKSILIESNEDIITDIDGEKGPSFPLRISCESNALKLLGFSEEF